MTTAAGDSDSVNGGRITPHSMSTLVGQPSMLFNLFAFPDGQPEEPRVAPSNVGDPSSPHTSSPFANGGSNTAPRYQLLEEVQRWLSPPDPSTNHNVICQARHEGTAVWFLQDKTFKQWKSTGSLLWIHGKRVSLFSASPALDC